MVLESDLLSISTKSDHNYDNQLDLESESESETKSLITQRIINTARRAEPLMKIVKNFSKVAPVARKIDHEWVENYRTQETERYRNPLKAWEFFLSDGSRAVVAPVCKKAVNLASKAREHPVLKKNRPPFITILCLVRDAAAKMQGGSGTRADVCHILRESQYIIENTSDTTLSSIVSGALDRLHYEGDPCVKFDSDNKVWIYLHRDRPLNHPEWVTAGQTSNVAGPSQKQQ